MAVVGGGGAQSSKPWYSAAAPRPGPLQAQSVGVPGATKVASRGPRPAKGPGRSPARGAASDPTTASTKPSSGPATTTLLVPSPSQAQAHVHQVQVHHQAQARVKYISSCYSSCSCPCSCSSPPTDDTTTRTSCNTGIRHRSSHRCDADSAASCGCPATPARAPPSPTVPLPSLPSLSIVPPPSGDHDNSVNVVSGRGRRQREAKRPIMQRVSAFLPSWDKRNSSSSRSGFFSWSSNRSSTSTSAVSALARINTTAANGRVHREAFWPATLDGECEKAARILKSFSTDGCLAPVEDEKPAPIDEPRSPKHITKKIPRRIIQNAAGIAIFTCMRSGLWMTGSGGSGILIARKSDGTWSPPSGIMLHTPTLSFIIGVDIYDCVLVVNNLAALESITRPRVTLGEDVGLTSGPLVPLDSDEVEINWKDLGNTVLTYMKARGQAQDVNLNGCILAERGNENERFYSSNVTQMDILAGNVSRHVEETKPLFEVIKLAEGRSDYEAAVIEKIAIEPAPSDAMIATPKSSTPASPLTTFGIPNVEDPDPFGVLALEMAGLEIREAGTRLRPASSQFEFNPSPMSPAFSKFNRQSVDTYVSRSNRGSYMSSRTVKSQMTDAGTQTSTGNTPETTPSPSQSEDGRDRIRSSQMPEVTEEEEEVDYTKVDLTPLKNIGGAHPTANVTAARDTDAVEHDKLKVDDITSTDDIDKFSKASSVYEKEDEDDQEDARRVEDEDDSDEDDDDEEEEEPVVFEVAAVQPARTQAVASRVIHAKGNMVTIPKRVPPPLPTRSPARVSRSSKSEIGDVSGLRSPLRQAFSEDDLKGDSKEAETRSALQDDKQQADVRTEDDKSEGSDAEFFPAEESRAEGEKREEKEISKAESKTEVSMNGTDDMPRDDEALAVPEQEQLNGSDSVSKKHTSSIYTGTTEDRWSFDGSSLTTPTSDRPYSVTDDLTEEKTPKQPMKEAEATETKEKEDGVEKVELKEATSTTTITVA